MSEGTVEAALRQAVGDYITALMVDDGSHVAACERHMDEAFEAVGAALRSRGSSDGLVSDGGNEVELHAHKAAYELVTARSDLRAAKRRISQLEGERGSSDTRLTEALDIPRLPDGAIRCWEKVREGLVCEDHGDACRPPCERWHQGTALDTLAAMLHAALNFDTATLAAARADAPQEQTP